MRLIYLSLIIFILLIQVGSHAEIHEFLLASIELGRAATRWVQAVLRLVCWKFPSFRTVVDWLFSSETYPLVGVAE